jgi:hypothetical protein
MNDQGEFHFGDDRMMICPTCHGKGRVPLDRDFQLPVAREDDPETSHEAAQDATFRASEGRKAALRALSLRPMTDYELEKETGRQKNSIGKRRLDCQRAGLVEMVVKDGQKIKRPGPSRSMCLVWKLTSMGEEYVRWMP